MTIEDAPGDRRPADDPSPVDTRSGWWPSPWSAAKVAAGKVSRGGLQTDAGSVYWTESRPDQGGRQVVVGLDPSSDHPDRRIDISPPGVSVRSRVHEYGGGAATVAVGSLFYVDQEDQAWHRVDLAPGSEPIRLGGAGGGPATRYADGVPTTDGRWLLSVEEQFGSDSVTHRLVATATDGSGRSTVVVSGGDFFSSPRPSPDGRWLTWVTWDHPSMPWDESRLLVAPLDTSHGTPVVGTPVTVAGGSGISVGQPRWCRDGGLLFVDDRSGWWLLYRVPSLQVGGGRPMVADLVPLVDTEAEFHGPDWVFGQHTYAELADGAIVARRRSAGRDQLVVLHPPHDGPDAPGWSSEVIEQPCVSLSAVVSPDGRSAVILGSTPTEAQVVVVVDPAGGNPARRLSEPPRVAVATDQVSSSVPRSVAVGSYSVPGQFFPPLNVAVGPPDSPPPLIVFCHGGPTAAAEAGYDPVVQFFTSRGIAVAAVDYRGSTGYGRAYRDLLRGGWGEADVDDCITYAESLAADHLVDGGRMAIRGTSAGGLTALRALIGSRCFAGAVAWYGVTDLMALAADTHDFESRYLDGLVGPLPESVGTYRDRSPAHRAADLVGKVLLLHGSDDPIVPVSQAREFAERLRVGGADCRLVVFDGESHGFRRADTVESALNAELDFYRELFSTVATR
jgi:dipeptidyl aminopeptidase/acylaminoacyl peptidase